jgi:hypothetical protein
VRQISGSAGRYSSTAPIKRFSCVPIKKRNPIKPASRFGSPASSNGRALCSARRCFGRLGRPEEAANVALFPALDEGSYVTGVDIEVDGGMKVVVTLLSRSEAGFDSQPNGETARPWWSFSR